MNPTSRPRRSAASTLVRVATDGAIIAVAVPSALGLLVSADRGGCGMTPEFNSMALGLGFLGIRATWWVLKFGNDLAERWLASRSAGAQATADLNDTPPRTSTP